MSNKSTRQTARRKLRRKLEAQGWTPEEIEAEVQARHPAAGPVTTEAEWARLRDDRAAQNRARLRAEHAAATRRFRRDQERSKADWEARRSAEEDRVYGVDDTGYKPTHVDSTLTGTARATGETAKAIRRGRTITRHQHTEKDT